MRPVPPLTPSGFSPTTVGHHAEWLRQALRGRGVRHGGSLTARALNRLERVKAFVDRGEPLPAECLKNPTSYFADAYGADILSRVLHRGAERLRGFDDHWRAMRAGDPIFTRAADHSKQRGLIWELFVASVLAPLADEVSEAEPDLACSINGVHYGIACKTLNSESPSQHCERIVEGAEQLLKSPLGRGIVVAFLGNESLRSGGFRRVDGDGRGAAVEVLRERMSNIVARLPASLSTRATKRGAYAMIFVGSVIVGVDNRPVCAVFVQSHDFGREWDPDQQHFLETVVFAFNHAMHGP
jgi:hypothetical protein